jgi:hypothetical protein
MAAAEAAVPVATPRETAINAEASSAMADNLNTPIPNAKAVIRNMRPTHNTRNWLHLMVNGYGNEVLGSRGRRTGN